MLLLKNFVNSVNSVQNLPAFAFLDTAEAKPRQTVPPGTARRVSGAHQLTRFTRWGIADALPFSENLVHLVNRFALLTENRDWLIV